MVIKGGSRSSGGQLARHLLRTDTNEQVEVMELRGVAATTLPAALREMTAVAVGTRCIRSLYHASINTGPGEVLTAAQKAQAIATLEQRLGLTGHPRAVVAHRKDGRYHLHIVWCRIDPVTMRAVHDGHNYRKHEAVARDLERAFGHRPVQGAHVERTAPDGSRCPRPARTPPTAELQQAARTKTDPAGITAEITALWQAADSGPAFVAALHAAGYILARGDRRGFCLIDRAGGVHSLARRLAGVKTAEVNARLRDIDLDQLPSAAAARAQLRQRTAANPPLPKVRRARRVDRTPDPPRDQRTTGTAKQLSPMPVRRAENGHRSHRAGDNSAAPSPGRRSTRVAIPIPNPAAKPPHGGSESAGSRPAGALLRCLGLGGGGRRGTGPPRRAAPAGMLSLFLDARPVFVPGGGGAIARVTPIKGTLPERLNLRRPDGPATESIARIQQMIERLTAYGHSTGESTAEQIQELRNTLRAMLDQAAVRTIFGPYYRPEHRRQEPGR